LRADIDALPMQEHNTLLHTSQHAGEDARLVADDGHTADAPGAAQHFAKHRNHRHTVYLISSRAEEGGGGAREMQGRTVRAASGGVGVRHAQLARQYGGDVRRQPAP
jgi:metal-dependent amidase/aminoacylase/carboxypeptidase family protein